MKKENKTSQKRTFVPEKQGITAQNLTKQFENYGDLICTKYSTNFRDEQFEVFTSFGLDTDGVVSGDSVALQGDSSLSFTVKAKSYVRLKITLKSTVPKQGYEFYSDFDIPSFEVLLEGGDSFSAGTRKVGMGWEYDNLSIIKRDGYVTAEDGGSIDIPTERMTSLTGLDFLSSMNKIKTFNSINIKWLESWSCEDTPPEEIPNDDDDDEDSDFIPNDDDEDSDFIPNDDDDESESGTEPLSDDTVWAILGFIILLILSYYLFKGGGEDTVQES